MEHETDADRVGRQMADLEKGGLLRAFPECGAPVSGILMSVMVNPNDEEEGVSCPELGCDPIAARAIANPYKQPLHADVLIQFIPVNAGSTAG